MAKVFGPTEYTRTGFSLTAVLEASDIVHERVYWRGKDYFFEQAHFVKTPQGKRLWARWKTRAV